MIPNIKTLLMHSQATRRRHYITLALTSSAGNYTPAATNLDAVDDPKAPVRQPEDGVESPVRRLREGVALPPHLQRRHLHKLHSFVKIIKTMQL